MGNLKSDDLTVTVETAEGFPEYMVPFVHISNHYLGKIDLAPVRKDASAEFNAALSAFVLEKAPPSTPFVHRKVIGSGGRIVFGYVRIMYLVQVAPVGGTSESYEGHMWTLHLDSGKAEHESVTSYEANDARSWMEKRLLLGATLKNLKINLPNSAYKAINI